MITIGPTFEGLLAESFDQIRSSAKGNVAIMLRIIGALQTIAGLTDSPDQRRALRDQVRWIAELTDHTLDSVYDRARIDARLALVCKALEAEPALCAGKEKQT